MLNVKDIEKLAELARIEIPDDEKETLQKEVEAILGYVGEIQKVAGGNVEKTVGSVFNVARIDEKPHEPGEYTKDLLAEAPGKEEEYVKVKKIL